jgi:hypothetical protein
MVHGSLTFFTFYLQQTKILVHRNFFFRIGVISRFIRGLASPGGLWAEVEGGQGGEGGRGRVGRVQPAVQLGEGGTGQPPRVHLNPPSATPPLAGLKVVNFLNIISAHQDVSTGTVIVLRIRIRCLFEA